MEDALPTLKVKMKMTSSRTTKAVLTMVQKMSVLLRLSTGTASTLSRMFLYLSIQ